MQQHEHDSSSVSFSASSLSGSSLVVVGVDVSKAKLDCYVDPLGKWIHVANDDQGIAQLIDQLRGLALPIERVVIEATGRLHRRVAAELLAAGIDVALVNPQRAREYARSAGHLEKTDRVDARSLAAFGRGVRHRNLQQTPQKQVDLDDLISRRRGLIQMLSRRAKPTARPIAQACPHPGRKAPAAHRPADRGPGPRDRRTRRRRR